MIKKLYTVALGAIFMLPVSLDAATLSLKSFASAPAVEEWGGTLLDWIRDQGLKQEGLERFVYYKPVSQGGTQGTNQPQAPFVETYLARDFLAPAFPPMKEDEVDESDRKRTGARNSDAIATGQYASCGSSTSPALSAPREEPVINRSALSSTPLGYREPAPLVVLEVSRQSTPSPTPLDLRPTTPPTPTSPDSSAASESPRSPEDSASPKSDEESKSEAALIMPDMVMPHADEGPITFKGLHRKIVDVHAMIVCPKNSSIIEEFVKQRQVLASAYYFIEDNYKRCLSEGIAHNKEMAIEYNDSLAKMADIRKEFAQGPWTQGERIVQALSAATGRESFEKVLAEYCPSYKPALLSFAALNWYWYTQAVKQEKAYEQAAFQIEDPHNYLFRFLMHIKSMQENERSQAREKLVDMRRVSSHIKIVAGEEHGIDIPGESRGFGEYTLPNMQLHCLFKQLDNGNLFVKPEDHGTTNATDTVHHTVGFFASVWRSIFGGNEVKGSYKERFPGETKKLLNNFLQVALKSEGKPESAHWFATVFIYFNKTGQKIVGNTKEARIKAYLKEADLLGLKQVPTIIERAKRQYMVDNDKYSGEELAEGFVSAETALQGELAKYDTLDKRYGNEIILTRASMLSGG